LTTRRRRRAAPQQHGRAHLRQAVAQRDHLAAVVGAVARQQADLDHRIDHDAGGAGLLDTVGDAVDQIRQFAVGRQQDGLGRRRVGRQRHHLDDVDAVQRPAVAGGRGAQFGGAFGQRQVQAGLAVLYALHEVAQAERGLAGTGPAFEQVDAAAQEAAAQDSVELGYACDDAGKFVIHLAFRKMKSCTKHAGCHFIQMVKRS
jgi:hypothetical protein